MDWLNLIAALLASGLLPVLFLIGNCPCCQTCVYCQDATVGTRFYATDGPTQIAFTFIGWSDNILSNCTTRNATYIHTFAGTGTCGGTTSESDTPRGLTRKIDSLVTGTTAVTRLSVSWQIIGGGGTGVFSWLLQIGSSICIPVKGTYSVPRTAAAGDGCNQADFNLTVTVS